jgi:O-antigen/teichoic acid export membrane protein
LSTFPPEEDGPEAATDSAGASPFGIIRRFGWGLGDQLLSSVTNFLLVALVARAVSPAEFGAFSLAYATFTLSLGAVRAMSGDPLVVRYSSVSTRRWRDGVKLASGMALVAGVLIGSGCLVSGAVLAGSLGNVLMILGLALPLLLVQDTCRFAFFAHRRGGAAFLNDLTWTVVMLIGFWLMSFRGHPTAAWFTLSWAIAGCVASVVGLLQLRLLPNGPIRAVGWINHQRDLVPRFLAEFAVSTGTQSITSFGVGALSGLAQLGALRAGQTALGPLNILFGGASLVTVPEGVRLLHESRRRFVKASLWISGGLAAAALMWAVVLLLLPERIGIAFLGDNWDGAQSVLLPLSIGMAAIGLSFGAVAGLRSMAAAKRSLRAKCIDAVVTIVCVLTGAAAADAEGAAWGFLVAGCLRNPNFWWQFSKALGEYRRS